MHEINKRLSDAREKKEISLSRLSAMTGIPKSTLQRYEAGVTKKIPLDAIHRIEKSLLLSPGTLSGSTEALFEKTKSLHSPATAHAVTKFAVIGDIAAGFDHVAVEDWTGDTVEIPTSYLGGRKQEDFIVLRVKGDSMYPLYHDGDKVLILKQSTLNHSGEIGAVVYNDDCVTIKKVEYAPGEDWLDLIPVNPSYMPQRIEGEALTHCAVIGIPKLLIREF